MIASHPESAGDEPLALEEQWVAEDDLPLRPARGGILAGALALMLVAGWTVLFVLANQSRLMAGGGIADWAAWIRDWSIPVLLIAVLWLVAMRNSRREAFRFGETARMLSDESNLLESRLTTINRELSLAREFLAAQARDLDAMGRVATERLSLHSESLASLIQDNSARLDTIGTVSTAALENMEKLRGQLPVIASSAKDVTNNIANAGRTAHGQLEELIQGFTKLNQFGQASERQINSLRQLVDETLTEFNRRSEQLDTIATDRFTALTAKGDEFRSQLENHELEALTAIQTRAKAMSDELEAARAMLDDHEAESLESLRARLTSVRDESAAIGRSLREGEGAALDAWRSAVAQLEAGLRAAITRVSEIDEKAIESARSRLATLADEATDADRRMAERDKAFAAQIEQRRSEFDARHAEFSQRLLDQVAALDEAIAERRIAHEDHANALAAHAESLGNQLVGYADQMQGIASHGSAAEATIATSLTALATKLGASRDALAGTDREIASLTDASVRLLELIQASVQHSTHELPDAISISQSRLAGLESQATALRGVVEEVRAQGAELSNHVTSSNDNLVLVRQQLSGLNADFGANADAQTVAVTGLHKVLSEARDEAVALSEHAQKELRQAIEALNDSARAAVRGIEDMSAASVHALAARLGDESGEAIEKAMRNRAAEVSGQLEQAAAHAAGVSREAAVQLRDQLAKVNELAGNLERRVAHARSRAEEQVDNDFARRVALITESLNSNAIDIARAMDSDVSDTAWSAYLKGDRGIFTRRAVRLLEAPDAKAVAQLYESDAEFRDNVSRYIHDFEAMLRQLLSTRDGHALGVTLLSSDMGKLYVALAQSIERLRN